MAADAAGNKTGGLRADFNQARRALDAAVDEVESWEVRIADLEARTAGWHDVEADQIRFQDARELVDRWRADLKQPVDLRDRQAELESAVMKRRIEVEARRSTLEAEIRELETVVKRRARLDADRGILIEWSGALAESVADLDQRRRDRDAIAAENSRLATRNAVIVEEGLAARERMRLLEGSEADCVVCGQPVDGTLRSELLSSQAATIEMLLDSHRGNRERLDELRIEQFRLDAAVGRMESETAAERARLEAEAARGDSTDEAGKAAEPKLAEAVRQFAEVNNELSSGRYAAGEHTALLALDMKFEEAGCQLDEYRTARQVIFNLSAVPARHANLTPLRIELDEAVAAHGQTQAKALELGRSMRELTERLESPAKG